MKKTTIPFLWILFFSGSITAQVKTGLIEVSSTPKPSQHYLPEYTFDTPSDPSEWKQLGDGMHTSFASIDELYLRSEVPEIEENPVWVKTGWKGERLNAQILVWSADSLSQVRVVVSDLVNAQKKIISHKNIQAYLVRYVLSNYPYAATDASCGAVAGDSAWLMPDRLEKIDRFDLPGNSVRPVWLTVDIPSDAEPGIYTGVIHISGVNHEKKLTVKIRVQNSLLPAPKDWTFRLDLWQNPWVVAWYYQVDPWSAEHMALLKKHLKLYADAGGKYITTYAVHSPWSDNSYMIEGTMIEWIRKSDDLWEFDYGIFDQYVELAIEAGVDKAITIYTPVPWGHRFRYLDEQSGNYVYGEWSPESEKFRHIWKIFLDDLQSHLKSKGWMDKTYLGINENPMNITIAAAKFIKAHSKSWKITYAGDWHPELTELLDDYSPIISSEPSPKELAARREMGFTTTFYVCCTPPQPNNFVFSPPIESTFIGWYAASYGYDGFLRWAYDAWPEDPMRDARHTLWPAGDCFLVYPGGGSSIRFERLREGISDFEKVRILRAIKAKSADKKFGKMFEEFEKHLATMSAQRDHSKRDYTTSRLKESVAKGKQHIEALSDYIAQRD